MIFFPHLWKQKYILFFLATKKRVSLHLNGMKRRIGRMGLFLWVNDVKNHRGCLWTRKSIAVFFLLLFVFGVILLDQSAVWKVSI